MSENKSDEQGKIQSEDKKLALKADQKQAGKTPKTDKNGNKKEPISASKIFATIIIVLITIALVGTSIIYLIQANVNKANELRFGSYDGEKILYEANSIMYNQYASIVQQYPDQASSSDLSTQYQLWNQAYQNAVILTAVNKIAKQSDVRAPQELVDKAILESGYYNDENGNFSEAKYNEASNNVKASLNLAYKSQVPFSIITADESSVATPKAEQEFVASMASNTRSFEYIAIDYNAIADTVAESYLAQDPTKFKSITVSDITTTTEEDIDNAYQALQNGDAWNDVVAKYSKDSYASNNGSVGKLYLYSLQAICSEAQLEELFSTETGSYTTVMETSGAYRIFRVDAASQDPDFKDAETVAHIKNYMIQNETELTSPLLEEMAAKVAAEAQEDFDEAALSNGLQAVSVGSTPGNIGSSRYMGSFSYTDAYGLLATAAADKTVMTSLYTDPVGTVTDQIKAGNNYIVVKIVNDTKDLTQGQTVNLFYSYYGSTMAQNDFFSNILSSDKHENNFFAEFLKIFGGNSSTSDTSSN
ncbi:MAG: hypothetical protein GXZ16_05210 [Spirochaetales bacterium]|jgi:peptidyl-prolyl cis-trans isomerase D|nr:hypothetical protein [Spirochaetales bacterium]